MTWSHVRLGAVLRQSDEAVRVKPDEQYPIAGVYGFGRGLFAREPIFGRDTSYSELNRLREGMFVVSRVKAWEGAVGVVPRELDGYFVSKEFPSFESDATRLDVRWLKYFLDSEPGRRALTGCTKGIGARRERVKETAFLNITLPMPDVAHQRAVVEHLDAVIRESHAAAALRSQVEADLNSLLLAAYGRITDGTARRSLGEVAPLTRRPVVVDQGTSYPQIAVRSFGRGTFNKPALDGSDVTWEKPFLVEAGDILISNIKAWEGAIAVVADEDHGRFASHRYLTCVADSAVVTARYLCFHLLTPEGLLRVGEASPGSADRNRTLGAKALHAIPVPVPPVERQRWFDRVFAEVNQARRLGQQAAEAQEQLLPSVVQRLFAPGGTGARS